MRDGYKKTEIGVIPLDWEVVRLGDIAELTSSKRVHLSDYVDNGIPFYRGKEITLLKKNEVIDDLLYISEKQYNKIKNQFGIPKKNDILITAVGTLANSYRISNDNPFYFKDGNLIWLKEISQNSIYIDSILKFYKKQILDSAIGSSQKALTIKELKNIKIPLPPLTQQKKIAKILSTTDNKIEAITKQIEKAEMVKKGLMQKLFNEVEQNWKFFKLNEILEFKKEALKMKDEEKYELITVKRRFGGVKSRGIFLGKEVLVKNQFYLREKNFLISKRQISHGACGLVPKKLNGAIVSNEYNVFTSKKELLDLDFFNYYVQTPNLHRSFYKHSHGVHIEKMLFNTESWLKQKIIFPPLTQQKKIAKILSTSDQKIEILKSKKEQYQILKKGLMQKLLTGEIGV